MLIEQVRKTINEHDLIQRKQHIVLGLSGGPDSVCLFHVLMLLKEQMGITVYPVHLNHKFRPGEAESCLLYTSHVILSCKPSSFNRSIIFFMVNSHKLQFLKNITFPFSTFNLYPCGNSTTLGACFFFITASADFMRSCEISLSSPISENAFMISL